MIMWVGAIKIERENRRLAWGIGACERDFAGSRGAHLYAVAADTHSPGHVCRFLQLLWSRIIYVNTEVHAWDYM